MTNKEAISNLKELKKDVRMRAIPHIADIILESLDMAIKALEKDIAKEPVQTHKRYGHGYEYDDYYCPECDEFLAYEPQGNRYKQEGGWLRCKNCGQKIKWESVRK